MSDRHGVLSQRSVLKIAGRCSEFAAQIAAAVFENKLVVLGVLVNRLYFLRFGCQLNVSPASALKNFAGEKELSKNETLERCW